MKTPSESETLVKHGMYSALDAISIRFTVIIPLISSPVHCISMKSSLALQAQCPTSCVKETLKCQYCKMGATSFDVVVLHCYLFITNAVKFHIFTESLQAKFLSYWFCLHLSMSTADSTV